MSDSWHEKIRNKNREEIVSVGKELFLEYNFLNVNIKDICDAASISRVTFYKYFKSIDELIFEVQIGILSDMAETIKRSDKGVGTGKDRLKSMLYGWIDFAKEHRKEMKFVILFDLYYEAYDSNEELKFKYKSFITKDNKEFLTPVIEAGIKDSSLSGDLDSVKAGYYIFQTIMGLLQRMSYTSLPDENNKFDFNDVAEYAVNMIIKSIENVNNS